MRLTLPAATGEGRRHSAAVREPGPIQAPEGDRLGKGGHARGVWQYGMICGVRVCSVDLNKTGYRDGV